MTLYDILNDTDLVTDTVKIRIKDKSGRPIASGNWFQDQILMYQESEIQSFNYDVHANILSVILMGAYRLW